jgi:hypothetical protein
MSKTIPGPSSSGENNFSIKMEIQRL